MVISDVKLETDLPIPSLGSLICLVKCSSVHVLLLTVNHWAIARHLVLWVAFYLDMFGPEKNAVLSSGVGSDEARPLCWCCQGMLIMDYLAAFSFTTVRRCRPGVRCCSGRWGYDSGMGRKALRAKDLWVIWGLRGERSGMRDLSTLILSSYLRQTLNCATSCI